MQYPGFEKMVEPARPKTELWRLIAGLGIVAAVYLGLTRAFFSILQMLIQPDTFWSFAADVETGKTALGLLVLLLLMGAMGLGALVAAELVHQRRPFGLFGARDLFWRQFGRVILALSVLFFAIAILPPWPMSRDMNPGLPAGVWISLLPLTLCAILIQSGSEELLFRGYLQSQLAARFAHPLIWLTVPSALFALGHYAPAVYGSNAILVAIWAFVFGLATADLTMRAGTLGPAIALHLVNNTLAIAVISLQGDLSGLALYHLPFGPENEAAVRALLPLDLVTIGLAWLAARVAIRA